MLGLLSLYPPKRLIYPPSTQDPLTTPILRV